MNIHEYQAKELLRRYGVSTPRGYACSTIEEAVRAAQRLGGSRWMVKAQIHAGGRGEAGAVRTASSTDDVRAHASALLGRTLITRQTGPKGLMVRRLLVEESFEAGPQFYVGITIDRDHERAALIASGEGGIDIEEVAARAPAKLQRLLVDPVAGLGEHGADDIARRIGVPERSVPQARTVMRSLYRAFDECDASLAEINPLLLAGDDRMVALGAGFCFDGNALYRQPEIAAMRDPDQEDPAEAQAAMLGLNHVSLDGDIGCLCNGAGLAMATIDAITLCGGSPADFLDVGSATSGSVAQALVPMLRNPNLKAVLVNIHAGVAKCDVIANGIVAAATQAGGLHIALVVRMTGTNEKLGKKILAQSGLPIIAAKDMAHAVALVVAAAKGR